MAVKTQNIVSTIFKWAIIGVILYVVFTLLPPALVPFIGTAPKTWALVEVVVIIGVLYGLYLDFGSALKLTQISIIAGILAIVLLSASAAPMVMAQPMPETTGMDRVILMLEDGGGTIIALIETISLLAASICVIPVTFFSQLLDVEGVTALASNLLPAIENSITGAMYGLMLTVVGGLPTLCYCVVGFLPMASILLSLGACSGFITGIGGEWYDAAPRKFPGIVVP